MIETSRRGFLGGLAATLLVSATGVKLAVPQTKPLLAANGWPICNGQILSRANYGELFKVITHVYGGDGDTFHLPNFGHSGPFLDYFDTGLVHAICPTMDESSVPIGYVQAMLIRLSPEPS